MRRATTVLTAAVLASVTAVGVAHADPATPTPSPGPGVYEFAIAPPSPVTVGTEVLVHGRVDSAGVAQVRVDGVTVATGQPTVDYQWTAISGRHELAVWRVNPNCAGCGSAGQSRTYDVTGPTQTPSPSPVSSPPVFAGAPSGFLQHLLARLFGRFHALGS